MEETKQPKKTIIDSGTVVGSTFSQLVNVSVNDTEVTLEFAFINPRDPSTGQVVSRVTLPKVIGLQLAQLIIQTSNFHEKKKRGKKDD